MQSCQKNCPFEDLLEFNVVSKPLAWFDTLWGLIIWGLIQPKKTSRVSLPRGIRFCGAKFDFSNCLTPRGFSGTAGSHTQRTTFEFKYHSKTKFEHNSGAGSGTHVALTLLTEHLRMKILPLSLVLVLSHDPLDKFVITMEDTTTQNAQLQKKNLFIYIIYLRWRTFRTTTRLKMFNGQYSWP